MRRTIIRLCASLLAGAIAVSCAETMEKEAMNQGPEQILPVAAPDSVTFTAHLEQDTRTQLGESYSVCWSEGDLIKVYNAAHPEGIVFELTKGAGSPEGSFSGPDPGDGPFYAVYPSSMAGTMTVTAIPVTIPSSQAYEVNSFGPGANLGAGMASQLDGICFHNLAGVLCLTLTGNASISRIRVISYDDVALHGKAVIDGWDQEMPTLAFDPVQETEESIREITLDCGTGASLSADGTTFYFALPAGTLASGYRIEVYDTDGLAMVKYAKAAADNTISRGNILLMPGLTYSAGYKAAFLESDKIGAIQHAAVDGTIAYPCTYVEGRSQYAYLNTTDTRNLRLQDWDDGYALRFAITPKTLQAGKTCSVTIQSDGLAAVQSTTVDKMRVVKIEDGKVWMLDPATGNGYILMMED